MIISVLKGDGNFKNKYSIIPDKTWHRKMHVPTCCIYYVTENVFHITSRPSSTVLITSVIGKTWTLRKDDIQRLTPFKNSCLGSMVGENIRDRIRFIAMRKKA